jgi:hypothetical protein
MCIKINLIKSKNKLNNRFFRYYLVVVNRYSNNSLSDLLGVASMSLSLNHRVEATMFVGSIMHSEDGTIRFMKRVRPFDHISFANLFLLFNVASVLILYSIFESVLGRSLLIKCVRYYTRKDLLVLT